MAFTASIRIAAANAIAIMARRHPKMSAATSAADKTMSAAIAAIQCSIPAG